MMKKVTENDIELVRLVLYEQDEDNDKANDDSIGIDSNRRCNLPLNVIGILLLIVFLTVSVDTMRAVLSPSTCCMGNSSESSSSARVPTILSLSGLLTTSELAAQQIKNYKQGTALIVNVHITHHAGTSFCNDVGRAQGTRGAPGFACMKLDQGDDNVSDVDNYPEFQFPLGDPWRHNASATNIAIVRPFFHFVSWEFSMAPTLVPLTDTDWENPNLVSVIIMRDPMSRLLAGSRYTNRMYPTLKDENCSLETWQSYAHDNRNTDNYALRILAGNGCCHGQDTKRTHLETAMSLLQRFTFVLDLECYDASVAALQEILGITNKTNTNNRNSSLHRHLVKSHKHPPNSERIPYREVYDYLLRKNTLDIELYNWSKSRSLVNCSALY